VNGSASETQRRPATSAVRVGVTLGGIVLAAVVIFGLGVLEGSRVAGSLPEIAAPPSTLPTAPAPAMKPDKLTFYDRLSGVAPPTPAAFPEGQPTAPALKPGPTASQEERARQPEARPPQVPAVAAPRTTAAKTKVLAKSEATAQIRKLSGTDRFSVQMAAVSNRTAAARLTAQIKSNGFDAVTVRASIKGRIFYRIRVGNFPSKKAAAEAADIFRSAFALNGIPVEN